MFFAIIAPEVVALNAWRLYRAAKILMKSVNYARVTTPSSRTVHLSFSGLLSTVFLAIFGIPDRLRLLLRHRSEIDTAKQEQLHSRNDSLHTQLHQDKLPWTIDVAFYAISGGCVLGTSFGVGDTLSKKGIKYLAQHRPRSLISAQEAVLQDPSKASGLAKPITCIQALWFCSQCTTRLSQIMAISLIELNTFGKF